MWLEFGERCTEHILNHIENIGVIESVIRKKMEGIIDMQMYTEDSVVIMTLKALLFSP